MPLRRRVHEPSLTFTPAIHPSRPTGGGRGCQARGAGEAPAHRPPPWLQGETPKLPFASERERRHDRGRVHFTPARPTSVSCVNDSSAGKTGIWRSVHPSASPPPRDYQNQMTNPKWTRAESSADPQSSQPPATPNAGEDPSPRVLLVQRLRQGHLRRSGASSGDPNRRISRLRKITKDFVSRLGRLASPRK